MLDEKKPLNVAMVGCGGYAGYLIDRIFEIPDDCRLVAITTRRPESDAALKYKAQGVAVYRDIDELLASVTPDECPAVLIPTSIDSHFEYTKKVMDRGFHVLLEKPPAATIQDVDRMIELQRSSGRWIAVNFQYLFSPMTRLLKKRLASGEFGKVLAVKGRTLWTRPESYFSRSSWSGKLSVDDRWVLDGTIGNPLAHLLAEALYLATPSAGMALPASVQAELYRVNDIESEDTSCLHVKTMDGVDVFFYATLCHNEMGPVICEIETEKADLRLTEYFQLSIHWKGGREETSELPNHNDFADRREMLRGLSHALREERRPLVTVEDCRPYVLTWNGAFESAGIPAVVTSEDTVMETTTEGRSRIVPGMDTLIGQALRSDCLFSDLDVSWAVPGRLVDLKNYDFFPSIHPEFLALNPEPSRGC